MFATSLKPNKNVSHTMFPAEGNVHLLDVFVAVTKNENVILIVAEMK